MSFFNYLTFFHVLFMALFTGSFAAMALLWARGRGARSPQERAPFVEGTLAISRRLTTLTASLLLLVGILMIIDMPGLLYEGPLIHIKITIGVILVGVSHVVHFRLKKAYAALHQEEPEAGADRFLDLATALVPAVAFITIFLGIIQSHG
jgi:uncharacterized membrane protein